MPVHDPITSLAPGQPLFSPDGHDWSWAYVFHRDVPEFPGYAAGTDGGIWSLWTYGTYSHIGEVWRPLKPHPTIHGRPMVGFRRSMKTYARTVHRIVMETFIGPRPPGMECCHGNGNPLDNRLDNLRWDTPIANAADKVRHGTVNKGERNGQAKLIESQILEIRELARNCVPQYRIGATFGITQSMVNKIVRRQKWAHVP